MNVNEELADILSAVEHTERFEKHVAEGNILGMVMPNGKPLGDCTFEEIGRYGEWLSAAGKKLEDFSASTPLAAISLAVAINQADSAKEAPNAKQDTSLNVTRRGDGTFVAEFGPRPTSGVVQYRDPNQAQLQDTLRQTVEFFRSTAAHGPRS